VYSYRQYSNHPHLVAERMFARALMRGRLRAFMGKMLGQSHRLLSLSDYVEHVSVTARFSEGRRTVRLSAIRGTLSRVDQFDDEFYPLVSATRSRWISVATGMLQDMTTIPPLELIRVGEIYFVDDGHHRVSVALRLGYIYFDADVTVWEVAQADLDRIENN